MDCIQDAGWVEPERFPDLSHEEIHVWRFGLDPDGVRLSELEAALDVGDLARADRFRGKGLRSRFVAGRGMLRFLLGAYLGRDPARIAFSYGNHGKPRLADSNDSIAFNLAHSGEIALCAVTIGRAVGVDVESMRPFENAERIIQRFFSITEQKSFLLLPEAQRFEAFYLGWTRKEAFLKARGTGLATPLDSFDVTLAPGKPAAILRVDDDLEAHRRWSIIDLDPGTGYAGALVVEADSAVPRISTIRLFDGSRFGPIPSGGGRM